MTAAPGRVEWAPDVVAAKAAQQAELRAYGQLVKLLGRPVQQPARAPGNTSAILVPGFISGDVSLTVLARGLRRSGHRTFRSEIGANLGCTDDMVERLLRRVEGVVEAEDRRIALVGHSRGGMVVKLAAARRPDLVAGIVVLSGPVTGTLGVAPHVRRQLEGLFRLHDRGGRFASVISAACVTGECAARTVAELLAPWPADVDYTSVYSTSDAIIDWHTCLDPAAELIEVRSSHTGMGTDPAVRRIVADRLKRIATTARPKAGGAAVS
ncbi:esterase/lipase family protein [uncultured Jatrophihabitans sp.]|uniref:esterase/lipase family protein n=1 Tax=uncultured Jatrophihabitans sp. TaxID=1610747 RepID=UPI0035CAD0ED